METEYEWRKRLEEELSGRKKVKIRKAKEVPAPVVTKSDWFAQVTDALEGRGFSLALFLLVLLLAIGLVASWNYKMSFWRSNPYPYRGGNGNMVQPAPQPQPHAQPDGRGYRVSEIEKQSAEFAANQKKLEEALKSTMEKLTLLTAINNHNAVASQ